jgi:hypothetical protein
MLIDFGGALAVSRPSFAAPIASWLLATFTGVLPSTGASFAITASSLIQVKG